MGGRSQPPLPKNPKEPKLCDFSHFFMRNPPIPYQTAKNDKMRPKSINIGDSNNHQLFFQHI